MTNHHNTIAGIIWIIVFCILSVVADSIVRYVTMQGFPSSEILFIRSLFGMLLLLPFVLKNKTIFVKRHTLKLYIARGIFAFCSISIWFYILKYTDLAALTAVGFAAPLFTTALSVLWLGEKYNSIKVTALIIGFVGAMIVINPMAITFNWYLLLGVVASFMWAISMIFAKRLSNKENPVTVSFFFALALIPPSFILALAVWQWPTMQQWLLITALTGVTTLCLVSLSKALLHADLATLMPFQFSQLIFAALFAYIIFGDTVTLNTLLGGVIIFGSGYIIIRSEHKKHRQEELQIIP